MKRAWEHAANCGASVLTCHSKMCTKYVCKAELPIKCHWCNMAAPPESEVCSD
jgi:hypothetical protein